LSNVTQLSSLVLFLLTVVEFYCLSFLLTFLCQYSFKTR